MANQLAQGKMIKMQGVRLSFPQLHEAATPKGYDDSEPKFNCNFLLDPENDAHKAYIKQITAEIKRLISESWGEKPAKMKPVDCFGKGEKFVSTKTNKPYTGYEGTYAISASNSRRPMLKGRDKGNLTPEEAHKMLYGGCYVNGIVKFWVQDNKFGQAIRCSLEGVMFFGDGEAFGSGGADDEDFEDFDTDGELSDQLDAVDGDLDDLGDDDLLGDDDGFDDDEPF